MQAIILATDEQLRLPPLSDTTPTPLIPVVDRPVMATAVEILARHGQKRLLVSLYHRGGSIAAYFGSGSRWGINIEYLTQRESWGSAGALKWASRLLNETFLVIPGDAVLDLDIEAAMAYHRAHGGMATAILHYPAEDHQAPIIHVTADGRVAGVGANGLEYSEMVSTGAFIFDPGVLNHIPAREPFDIITNLIPALLDAGESVYGYEMTGYWNPLDSLSRFQEAQQVFLYSAYSQSEPERAIAGPGASVRYPSLPGRQVAPGIWVGKNDSIHPSVMVAAPVYIGANSWIGREVELGPGSVIGSNVVIDEEATVRSSTVLRETYVGQLLRIEDRVVGATMIIDPASAECTQVVDPFLLSWVGGQGFNPHRFRRFLSIFGSIVLFIVLSPFFLLAGLLALLGNGGNFLVSSLRYGQRVEGASGLYNFNLLNFRTRKVDGSYAPFGRFLERWELHRLSELVNVLRGDIDLVGTKPLSAEEVDLLTEEWHQKRHESQSGFTGLWYVQTAIFNDMDSVLVADVYYTATRTRSGDVLLLLRTPMAWLRRHVLPGERNRQPGVLVQADM